MALTRALPPHLLVRGQPCGLGAPGGRPTAPLRAHLVGAGIPGSSQRGRRPSLRGPVGFSRRRRRPSFWKGPPWCSGRNFHTPALGWGILLGWHPPQCGSSAKEKSWFRQALGLLRLRVKKSLTHSSRPLTSKEREFTWSRRQTWPISQMRKLRFGKRKLSSQGRTAKKRHRSRIHTPSGLAVSLVFRSAEPSVPRPGPRRRPAPPTGCSGHGAGGHPATTAGPAVLSQVFPSGVWIPAQPGMCSQDVNSNLPGALAELSSSLSDNIPKFQKSRAGFSNQAAGQRSGLTLSLPLTPPVCLPAAALPQLPPPSALPWPAQRPPHRPPRHPQAPLFLRPAFPLSKQLY